MPSGYLSKLNAALCRQQGVRSLICRRSSESLSSLCSTSTSKPVLGDHLCVDDIQYSYCNKPDDLEKPGAVYFGDITRKGYPHRPWLRNFSTTLSTSYFARGLSKLSFDTDPFEVVLEKSSPTVDPTIDGGDTLKLVSGAICLPHPDKEKTGGEDAYFICSDGQAFGVADGVGVFARELMSNSVKAIQEEPKGFINPARVLEKAHAAMTAKGSSTACIIALAEKELHAINLGDSGFIVVKDGCSIFRSRAQQHDFNVTYQLESGNGADLPSSGEVYTVPIAKGDVVVAATNGVFDNLYSCEIKANALIPFMVGLEPKEAAQKVAALALHRSLDKNRMTPFSAAAQGAGHQYYGGKPDDITVIVSYITSANS